VETIPKPPKTDYNGVKIDNQEDKATAQNWKEVRNENGSTTNKHTNIL
jgi:hypothetical protein